jgi:diamine N-acetyltransferase
MNSITVPSLNDLPILTEMARKTFWESHGHSAAAEDIEGYVDSKLTEEAFRAELLDERNILHWLHHDGRPAGYSKIILNSPNELIASQNVTKLERLYFLEEFHGLGLGQQLFAHNLQIAQQTNQAGVWLYAWKGNHRAIAFYLKIGFDFIGDGLFKISERHSNPNHVMYLVL